jgi:S-DNA-T family DNA segregation ATPase FtsK/SpoIIIE
MPQLLSRMDDLNWLTPSIADILEQGAAPPGGDGSMRELINQLQDEFAALETPAKVVNLRPTPSYTMFLLQAETVGRLGNRRTVTPAELRRSTGQIAEKHKEWRLGFVAQVEDAPDNIGILMRTEKHRPLSLRRLLIRNAFRDYPSALAYTLGNTLEQRLIVRDLENTPHLLIVGDGIARQHFISSLLLTFTLLNSPNEIRLALAGRGSEQYTELTQLPHMLNTQVEKDC